MPKSLDLKPSIVPAIGFILLALFVSYYPINPVDIAISNITQQFHHTVLDQIMVVISAFGNISIAFVCVLATALLFFIFGYKREAAFILAISATGLITFTLKNIFNRPRPTSEHVTLIETYRNNSFPSGHTLSYIVFFGFLILLMHRLTSIPKYLRLGVGGFSYFMFIAGPISRVYLGAHWFTDILGGFIIGILCLKLLKYYYDNV